ncbi:MAG: RimK family alpha-L-glutamate ligase [archaeon]
MKAAIISLGSKSSKWTAEAMLKHFDEVDTLDLREIEINISGRKSEVLYQGTPIKKYDCIFAKGSFRYAPLLRSITSLLNKETYMPLSASAFTIGHDKLLTHLRLQQHKIPMPTTYLSATTEAAKKILEKVNYPIIMKFPQGTQGKGVLVADSFASASSMLDALSALNQPFLIQEYVDTGGTDIRAFVVGNKVIAAMKRKANVKEVRSNIHAGGIGEKVELNSLTKKIAIDAAHAIGADICGVDIMESAKGPLVIEVNLSPGLQGIYETTGIDIAGEIAKLLKEKTLSKSEEKKTDGTTEMMKDLDVEKSKEIISNLDFRGTRILLPEVITKIADLKETDDVQINAKKGYITIKKFKVS